MDPKDPGLPRPEFAANARVQDEPIAIIGMSCRFPGDATDPEAFWEMLIQAKDAWSKVPQERFNVDGFYHPQSAISGAVSDHQYSFGGIHIMMLIRNPDDLQTWPLPQRGYFKL